jgi:hypothetical protein
MSDQLILKRASLSRPSGEWNDDDYDVLCDGAVVGRIYKRTGAGPDRDWFWRFAYDYFEDRIPIYGYAESRKQP